MCALRGCPALALQLPMEDYVIMRLSEAQEAVKARAPFV